MEVQAVGIWNTTFSIICKHEKVMYTNSELSNKNCINYKTEFDWNEHVEFDVTSLDQENIKNLKKEIEE